MKYQRPQIITNYDQVPHPQTDCSNMPCMAQQEFKDEADINNVVKKHTLTNRLLPQHNLEPFYADLSTPLDLSQIEMQLKQANQAFLDLPMEVRERVGQDPKRLSKFLADPENKDFLIKQGLFNKPAEIKPEVIQKVEIINKEALKEPKTAHVEQK